MDVKLIGVNDSIGTSIPTFGVIIAKDIQKKYTENILNDMCKLKYHLAIKQLKHESW